ncbi:MAG: 3-oxoadipate enol-lactonase [Povalibacter sp.]
MKLVTVEDAQLRCEHTPRPGAPALMLINSLGTSLEMWDDQLDSLQQQFELVRYDARGHGESSAGSTAELTLERLGRDALAVLDACGIARAHLCGISLGGMTVMQVASGWPDRVLKIALCSTAPYMPPRENWDERMRTVTTQGMGALAETILSKWFTEGFRASAPERVDKVRKMLLSVDPLGYAACCAAIRDMDLRPTINTITATTLVIGGSQDAVAPERDLQLIADSISGARLRMLDAAHLVNIERSDEFTQILLSFLGAESPQVEVSASTS